jgi:hypothetical protein
MRLKALTGKRKRLPLASLQHAQAYHFARLAIRHYLERAAAHLAISCKSLGGDARVDHKLEALPAIGTLHIFRNFHSENLRCRWKKRKSRAASIQALKVQCTSATGKVFSKHATDTFWFSIATCSPVMAF